MKVLNRSRGRTRLEWQLHSLASPVQCVSIRAQQGHMGKKELIFGTRFFVQACMKFDTWQVCLPLWFRYFVRQPCINRVYPPAIRQYCHQWNRSELWNTSFSKRGCGTTSLGQYGTKFGLGLILTKIKGPNDSGRNL